MVVACLHSVFGFIMAVNEQLEVGAWKLVWRQNKHICKFCMKYCLQIKVQTWSGDAKLWGYDLTNLKQIEFIRGPFEKFVDWW